MTPFAASGVFNHVVNAALVAILLYFRTDMRAACAYVGRMKPYLVATVKTGIVIFFIVSGIAWAFAAVSHAIYLYDGAEFTILEFALFSPPFIYLLTELYYRLPPPRSQTGDSDGLNVVRPPPRGKHGSPPPRLTPDDAPLQQQRPPLPSVDRP